MDNLQILSYKCDLLIKDLLKKPPSERTRRRLKYYVKTKQKYDSKMFSDYKPYYEPDYENKPEESLSKYIYDISKKSIKSEIDEIILCISSMLDYNSKRPSTTPLNCDIKVRYLKKQNLTYDLKKLRKCVYPDLQDKTFGAFLISRYPDSILAYKSLYTVCPMICHTIYKANFTYYQKDDIEFITDPSEISLAEIHDKIPQKLINSLKEIVAPEIAKQEIIRWFNDYCLNDFELASYLYSNKRFIIIMLQINFDYGRHANTIIYDTISKVIEYCEPCVFFHRHIQQVKEYVKSFFQRFVEVKDIIIMSEKCSERWQSLEGKLDHDKFDLGGYCLYWSYLYAELRLLNPDIHCNELHTKFIECIKKQTDYTLRDYIRAYFLDIIEFGREYLVFCSINNIQYMSEINLRTSKKFLEYKYKIKY